MVINLVKGDLVYSRENSQLAQMKGVYYIKSRVAHKIQGQELRSGITIENKWPLESHQEPRQLLPPFLSLSGFTKYPYCSTNICSILIYLAPKKPC